MVGMGYPSGNNPRSVLTPLDPEDPELDPEDPEDREDRAKLYANHVWGAFASTTSIIATTGGQSPDDDEGDNDGE